MPSESDLLWVTVRYLYRKQPVSKATIPTWISAVLYVAAIEAGLDFGSVVAWADRSPDRRVVQTVLGPEPKFLENPALRAVPGKEASDPFSVVDSCRLSDV